MFQLHHPKAPKKLLGVPNRLWRLLKISRACWKTCAWRCHRWSTLRSFDLCARRSTRCLTNIQQQCTTSHIRVVGTQITNKYKIWTGMESENIHWGPLGTISHTSWKVSKLWQDRAGGFNPCRIWCVAGVTYVTCLHTKKIHAINKSIKTYLNIIFYKRIQNDIHNISIYIHQNKDHIISIIPSSRIMYIYIFIFIFIFISLPWISSKHMVIVDIENYKYTQNNAYTCGWPSPGHSGWKHSSGISAIYSGLLAAIIKETSTSGY